MIKHFKPNSPAVCKRVFILLSCLMILFVLKPAIVTAENNASSASENTVLLKEPDSGGAAVMPGDVNTNEDEDAIVIILDEPIPGAPAMTEQPEISAVQDQTQLPESLPKTGGFPTAVLYSFGAVFSIVGILLKKKMNKK